MHSEIFMKMFFSWKVTMPSFNQYWWYFWPKLSCLYKKFTQTTLLIKCSKLVVIHCKRGNTCNKLIDLKKKKTIPWDVFQMWLKTSPRRAGGWCYTFMLIQWNAYCRPVSCILYPLSCILYPVSCILYPVSCIHFTNVAQKQ